MSQTRKGMILAFLVLLVAVIAALLLRWALSPDGPGIQIHLPSGAVRTVRLGAMKRLPAVSRSGVVQNQFGNWRDAGVYTGVALTDLLSSQDYAAAVFIARDGYRVTVPRSRIEDPEYPMILAYAFEGSEVPAWPDGFRIVVLPEDGDVSNAEYGATSAGSFWVKNVVSIELLSTPPDPSRVPGPRVDAGQATATRAA